MDEENEVRSRQNGNSSKSTFASKTIKSSDRDARALAKHGKRQQLNVGFVLGQRSCADKIVAEFRYHFCHCIQLDHPHLLGGNCYVNLMRRLIGTWLTLISTIGAGFLNGGPVSLIYGFFLSWTGTLALCLSLAEMASIAPISSAQYHFVAMLTPPGASKLLSWLSGMAPRATDRVVL